MSLHSKRAKLEIAELNQQWHELLTETIGGAEGLIDRLQSVISDLNSWLQDDEPGPVGIELTRLIEDRQSISILIETLHKASKIYEEVKEWQVPA